MVIYLEEEEHTLYQKYLLLQLFASGIDHLPGGEGCWPGIST